MHASSLVVALAVAAVAAQGSVPAPAELLARVQQRYEQVRDFEADFVQRYEGGVLKTTTTERGSMAIKRPGRMRWTYTQPEKKEFVADGARMYSYLPADKQVIVSPMPADVSTPAMFLAGNGNLVKDFTASPATLAGDAPAGLIGLTLTPKQGDPEFESLVLGIDPATSQIRVLTALDRQGGRSTFVFANIRENRGLSDKMFEFRIPRGVDVISNGLSQK